MEHLKHFDTSNYCATNNYKSIVKIGANDGVNGDNFYNFISNNLNIRGLFVEPVPFFFNILKEKFSNFNNIIFKNIAISDNSGEQTFYYLDPTVYLEHKNAPVWLMQLGSFDSNHIKKHCGDKYNKYIVKVSVKTETLMSLLKENNMLNFDILHIDTEGYDWKILKQLDLSICAPKLICFEHKHIAQQDLDEAYNFLKYKYNVKKHAADCVCFLL
jgi:FkbM family methyltransferase